MKKKINILGILFCISIMSLQAQIARQQADIIALEHLQTESVSLYVNTDTPSANFVLTTYKGETVRVLHLGWVYFVVEDSDTSEPSQQRYLVVKAENGSLAEIITSNDFAPADLHAWIKIENQTSTPPVWEEDQLKFLYPNPVRDFLTVPYAGAEARVEIFNLQGNRLFSKLFSGTELNVSFLNAGIYIVSVSDETGRTNYRIIKK